MVKQQMESLNAMSSSNNSVNPVNMDDLDLFNEEEERKEDEEDEDEDEFLGKQRRVVDVLGDGSFGQVLKCYNHETETLEAVKIMKSRSDVIGMARHEIRILQQLRHLDPDTCHIVRFNNFFFNLEDICLSFELLDVDLHNYICQTMPYETGLDLSEVRHIMQQLVKALHHLKTIGMIHADIKPGNIMVVDRQEKPLRVKLVDFGGAQQARNIDFETFICTRMYSPPEVLLFSDINEAVDMWSLGATTFELATGITLFPYKNHYRLLHSIVKLVGEPPDHVLDKGQQTEHFFNKEANGDARWTMKTAEECGFEDRGDGFNGFSEMEKILSLQHGLETGLDLFVDLLKHMLHVDPSQRITPLEAQQHPFFTTTEEKAGKLEETSDSAVDQLENPEGVQPETAVSQENPAHQQPENQVQMQGKGRKRNCFLDTWRRFRRRVARAAAKLFRFNR